MSINSKFDVIPIDVCDAYVTECAADYKSLLTKTEFDIEGLDTDVRFTDTGFSTNHIKEIIKKYSLPKRNTVDKKSDIYRSDLGELHLLRFFEKELHSKYPEEANFVIPLKNIEHRENVDMPARGLDLIGYRVLDKLTLLIGEAKVSDERASPPQVVNSTEDSIYKTHTKHRTETEYLLRKLSNVLRKLDFEHAFYLSQIVFHLEENALEKIRIVYACCLLRDSECFSDNDFGKMKTNSNEFEPNTVHFVVYCFSDSISNLVDAFYQKVLELN